MQVGTLAFSRHYGGKILEEMKNEYLQSLPSFKEAYDTYVADKRWKCYKKNLVKSVASRRKKIHCIDKKDVPGMIKTEQIYYLDEEDLV